MLTKRISPPFCVFESVLRRPNTRFREHLTRTFLGVTGAPFRSVKLRRNRVVIENGARLSVDGAGPKKTKQKKKERNKLNKWQVVSFHLESSRVRR